MQPRQAFALGSASLALLGCGDAAPIVVDPSVEVACPTAISYASPLVVDWTPAERRAIEARMTTGIAVVGYDCHGIHLLPRCHVEGSYDYSARRQHQELVQLQSPAEVRGSLPWTGSMLEWPAISELDHGARLDLGLVTAGWKRTARGAFRAADLVGSCIGATHFVRGATIGAFAVDAGAQGKGRSVADVFEGGARGGTILSVTERRVQGALAACATSRAGDEVPPEGCDAVFRIELAPIEATGPRAWAMKPIGDLEPECGSGMAWSDGKCATLGLGALQLCNTADFADCQAQCNRGEQKSCVALGDMYEKGHGVARDLDRARSLYEGACDRQTAVGCRSLGWLLSEGIGAPKDPALAISLYQQACDGGDPAACSNLGHMYGTGEGVTRDFATALRLSRKGCNGGDPNGCNNLGMLDENGWGVPRDVTSAAGHYRKACDGGNAMGCANLGNLLVRGRGVPVDRAQGLELLRRGCAGGNAWGCSKLELLGRRP